MQDKLKGWLSAALQVVTPVPGGGGSAQLRAVGLGLAMAAMFGLFYSQLVSHVPIEDWLARRYLGYAAATVVFLACCLAMGVALIEGVLGRHSMPASEKLALAVPLGLYCFETVFFLLGVAQLYRKWMFWAAPAAMLIVAGPSAVVFLRRFWRKARHAPRTARPLAWWALVAVVVGMAGLLLTYVLISTPTNAHMDAHHKHLAIAEDFVLAGGIRLYPEGWNFGARPHYTSFAYLWAFLQPSEEIYDRMELSAHLEFAVVLWTCFLLIPALVRRFAPGADWRVTWVVRFLFPGFYLYDSSLTVCGDHIGAAFGPAIAILLFQALPKMEPRRLALLCVPLSAAAMVKYTVAMYLLPVPIAAVAVRYAILVGRDVLARRRPSTALLVGPLVAAATCLVLTAPFWLKNVVLYGNPVYPMFTSVFGGHPWTADQTYVQRWVYRTTQMWAPEHDWNGFLQGLRVMFTFSFVPHDWVQFHGKLPVFGSLFTLSLASIPLLPRLWGVPRRRLLLVVLWIHLTIFLWFWTSHQDRYLQALVPLMAAVTAALFTLTFRHGGWVGGAGVAALCGLQVIWAADIPFIPTHTMARHGSQIKTVVELLEKGWKKQHQRRTRVWQHWVRVGRATPEDATILIHDELWHLGLGRRAVLDTVPWQMGLSYGIAEKPADNHAQLRGYGVTHVYWKPRMFGYDTIAGDLMFLWVAEHYTEGRRKVSGANLARLKPTVPKDDPQFAPYVLYMTCRDFQPGLYTLKAAAHPFLGPQAKPGPRPLIPAKNAKDARRLARHAAFAVVDKACRAGSPGAGLRRAGWRPMNPRRLELYVRRSGRPAPVPGR